MEAKESPLVARLARLLGPTRQPLTIYVLKVTAITLIPSLMISALLGLALGGRGLPSFQATGRLEWVLRLALIVPLIETALMWPILLVIARFNLSMVRTALVSALVWALIHSWTAFTWGGSIFWPFFVFSYCFLEWRKLSLPKALGVTCLLHMCHNAIPVLALYLLAFRR